MGANPFNICDISIKSYFLNSYRLLGCFMFLGLNKISWRQSQGVGPKYFEWDRSRFLLGGIDKSFKNNMLNKINPGF